MKIFRPIRWTSVAVFALCFMIAVSSCSKKEVKEDEPLINPSGDGSGAAAAPAEQPPVDTAVVPATEAPAPADPVDLGTAYFDYDSFKINSGARSALMTNIDWLKSNPNATVQIEGHCDERGTNEYNLALGERRANAARDFMVRQGIAKSRLSVISYGEERPADPGHDEGAWAKNRRASFVILSR